MPAYFGMYNLKNCDKYGAYVYLKWSMDGWMHKLMKILLIDPIFGSD